MELKMIAQALVISGVVTCVATPGFAGGERCQHVGGGVLTNFLQPADCGGFVSKPLYRRHRDR